MASAASDTDLRCPKGATFKRDLTLVGVDVTTLAASAFELRDYAGGPLRLTVIPTVQSSAVLRVTITDEEMDALVARVYRYRLVIGTVAGEVAFPIEGDFTVTP
jgi:hypothetical protein